MKKIEMMDWCIIIIIIVMIKKRLCRCGNAFVKEMSPIQMSSLSFISIPKSPGEALSHRKWRQAIIDGMCTLQDNDTWEIVPLSIRDYFVVCRWLYTINVDLDGTIDSLKVSSSKRVDPYFWLGLWRWLPSCSYNDLNTTLYGHQECFPPFDLDKEVYTEQPHGFVAQGEFGLVCCHYKSLHGLEQSPQLALDDLTLLSHNLV